MTSLHPLFETILRPWGVEREETGRDLERDRWLVDKEWVAAEVREQEEKERYEAWGEWDCAKLQSGNKKS